jgi:fermentation-respiration switch protein FrsA (DUF1100 family)
MFATIVAIALGAGIAVAALAYLQTRSYLHPARVIATGQSLRLTQTEYREIELTTEDGLKLYAWYTPSQNGAVILVAHGHAATIPEDIYSLFVRHGYGVLAWNFRGHGKSEGTFTSLGYFEAIDAKAALDYALSQPGVRHVGAWGGSMGAAAMIRATARYPQIEAVTADSAYATLEDIIPMRIPYPVLRPLVRFFAETETGVSVNEVRPEDDIGKISPRAVFIIQGMQDGAIPVDSAQRLFDAAGLPRSLWTEESAHHLGMFPQFPEEYEKRVIKFFDEYLLGK